MVGYIPRWFTCQQSRIQVVTELVSINYIDEGQQVNHYTALPPTGWINYIDEGQHINHYTALPPTGWAAERLGSSEFQMLKFAQRVQLSLPKLMAVEMLILENGNSNQAGEKLAGRAVPRVS